MPFNLFGNQAQMPGQASQPSGLARLLQPEVALPMAAALMQQGQGNMANLGDAFSMAGQGLQAQKADYEKKQKENQTFAWLDKNHPELAQMARNGAPLGEVFGTLMQQRFEKPKAPDVETFFNEFGQEEKRQWDGNDWVPVGGVAAQDATTTQQDYEYAVAQLRQRGVPEDKIPTFQEFAKPKSRGIKFTSADGTEIEIGGDDSDYGGTSLPAEVGGRIGLGDSFLKNDYPQIIKMIDAGDATGIWDYPKGVLGRGNSGIVQRRMASGADALRRGLTGAGMAVAEAEDYARRYLPQPTDDAVTLKRKAVGLKADLEAISSGAIKGKAGDVGGYLTNPSPTTGKRYRFNPETGELE